MWNPKSPSQLQAATDRRCAKVERKAKAKGWTARASGLASQPIVAIVAPPCQALAASELLRGAQEVKPHRLSGEWLHRLVGVNLDGMVVVIGIAPE